MQKLTECVQRNTGFVLLINVSPSILPQADLVSFVVHCFVLYTDCFPSIHLLSLGSVYVAKPCYVDPVNPYYFVKSCKL